MRDGRHGPPWWPEGEHWPPQGGHGYEAWAGFGRRMFFGFLVFAGAALFMAVVAGAVIATAVAGVSSSGRWQVVLGTVVLLAVGLVAVRSVFRRSVRPVGELIGVAGRLADGDYSARVDPGSSPNLRTVGLSINEMAERLEQAETNRQRLMSDLGHELRTPLAIIRGEIEAVVDGVRDGGPEHMGSLLDEVEIMERLIEDLRILAMSEAGQLRLQREGGDLVAIAREVESSYQATAQAQDVEIVVSADADVPEIEFDAVRIRQVVSNLVVNSLRAMPTGGRLDLTVATHHDRVVIDVSDSGAGIEFAGVDDVFGRFAKSEHSDGTGLGLSISRGLARAHGGDVEVASTGPLGTTMRVWLPR